MDNNVPYASVGIVYMRIWNHIEGLEFKIITIVLTLMGVTGGYTLLSNGVEWTERLLFSCYGLIIGSIVGLVFTQLVNWWDTTYADRSRTILIFSILGVAPMFWAYFDFEEHIHSRKGLVIMGILDALAVTLLTVLLWNKKRKLHSALLVAPVWQFICLDWFITLTWKHMNYWD